jgi:transcriptional regulator with XRE-family HTH domain
VKVLTQSEMLKKIGDNVAKFRKLRKYSQTDLCYEANIDISTLSRLERGLLNVSFTTLYKICKVLNLPPKDLFDF